MTDRKLLENAAKAIGLAYDTEDASKFGLWLLIDHEPTEGTRRRWNPLTDDGDAFRLAVKLSLLVMPYPIDNAVRVTRLDQPATIVSFGMPPDKLAFTRRAIVRAAAEIGKAMTS